MILEVRNLGKVYGAGGPHEKEAIRDVSFVAHDQEMVCVVGPSGAGKTTLLRCLAGLTEPTRGASYFAGEKITGTREGVAVVFQDYSRSLFPWLTVTANIALPLRAKSLPARQRTAIVEEVLHAVGLPNVGHRHPWQLSGGMQQRVAIARALAYRPRLLLMDEPFASVDAQTRFELEDLVRQVRAEFGMTIVFVTHDIDEAVYVGNRIIVLSNSPCVVRREIPVPLPDERDQATTRSDPRFVELRTEVLQLVTADGGRSAAAAEGPR